MTAQINDSCFHRKIYFALAGISGSGLFDPAKLGLQTVTSSTDCWRGFVAHYSILEGELFLTTLEIGLSSSHCTGADGREGPELFGVLPTTGRSFNFMYAGFQTPVPFTGGLLLADDFVRELYVHMGFHPPWKYQNVREVVFDAGRVTLDEDRSSEMAVVRTKFVDERKRSDGLYDEVAQDGIKAWIAKCFSREY